MNQAKPSFDRTPTINPAKREEYKTRVQNKVRFKYQKYTPFAILVWYGNKDKYGNEYGYLKHSLLQSIVGALLSLLSLLPDRAQL